jgi:ZIP family zinc transporter
VVYAGWMAGNKGLTLMGAAALSIGIAIQNFPEGAIVSLPLHAQGMGRPKALLYGVLSGVVEPIAAIITILASQFILPILPSLLSLAAGAMLYVVVEELVPEMSQGEHSDVGVVLFSIGFTLMMALDVALG